MSAGERVTVIWYDDTVAYINYSSSSTSSGKFGYISRYKLHNNASDNATDVGIVRTTSTTYYDTNGIHQAGTVSSGEYVALLSRANGWDYIEYNVSGGQRKRAFVQSSSIEHQYGTAADMHYYSYQAKAAAVDGWTAVYAGPDSSFYPQIGSITSIDINMYSYYQDYDRNYQPMAFISYYTSSGIKYGWISFYHEWE